MMNSTEANSTALALIAAPEWRVREVDKLKDAALAQLEAISQMESHAAMGGVLAGLTLHRVKASMPHGEWGKWLRQIGPSGSNLKVTHRHANRYMALAFEFIKREKPTMPDLLALPGDQTVLELSDNHETKNFLEKLRAFVGECSLNELLIKHDIKAVGLKTKLAAQKAAEEKAAGEIEPPTAEQFYEQSRDEIGTAIERLENLLLKENRLQYLIGRPELRGVVESLETLAKKIRKAAEPLLKEAAAAKTPKPAIR